MPSQREIGPPAQDGHPGMRRALLQAGCVLVAVALSACRPAPSDSAPELLTFGGPVMGTRFLVKVVGRPPRDAESLEREIGRCLDEIDRLMSTYRPDSELSRFNRFDRTEWFPVSEPTARVIAEAVRVGDLTGGALDVTVGPLVDLWNFGPERRPGDRVPSPQELDRARERIGYDRLDVRLAPPAVRKKKPDLSVDLSAIAKGFAVDAVADLLERRSIEHYMVEVGGEVRARGRNPRGRPWQIAVEVPLEGLRAIQRVVPVSGSALATSGDYRNYFEVEGVRYSHILDPRTGRPIRHELASASVLAPTCIEADALATGLMVLGPEAAFELAEREGLAVLLIIRTRGGFAERMTPRMEAALRP